jgi:hypothetical protein
MSSQKSPIETLNYVVFEGLGYANFKEMYFSLLQVKFFPLIISVSGVLTALATFLQKYLDLSYEVTIALFALLLLEMFTGLGASLKEGKKWNSPRFFRMLLKLGVYFTLLFVINTFKKNNTEDPLMIYSVIYYAFFNIFILGTILSVLENLKRLKVSEASRLYRYLENKMNKWFELDGVDNDDKKQTNDDEEGFPGV